MKPITEVAMPIESYYAPVKGAQRRSLSEVADRFAAVGMPCRIESEAENMFWLVFDSLASNILASVNDGVFVFGTFNLNMDDPPSIVETVDQVMDSIGFSADEDADY